MNDHELYRYSQQYIQDAHRQAANERLIRQAMDGKKSSPVITIDRLESWLGERLIDAGVRLKCRSDASACAQGIIRVGPY